MRVARNRDDGVTIEAIATDFGVDPMTLTKWMRQADIDEGAKPGKITSDSAELRELRRRIGCRSRRTRSLRREAAYLSQANLPGRLYPLVSEFAADGIPVAVTCQVLKLARQPYYYWRATPHDSLLTLSTMGDLDNKTATSRPNRLPSRPRHFRVEVASIGDYDSPIPAVNNQRRLGICDRPRQVGCDDTVTGCGAPLPG
jgi:transposase-like protein